MSCWVVVGEPVMYGDVVIFVPEEPQVDLKRFCLAQKSVAFFF